MAECLGSPLISSQTWKPVMSGRRTSSTATSTRSVPMRSSASAPVRASITWNPARLSQLTSR
jgi:hypothetical protein